MDVLPRTLLHRIVLDNFSDIDITNAKDVLHFHISVPLKTVESNAKVLTSRNTNVDDISKVLDEIDPNNIPIFVARDLAKLPSVDLNHVNVFSLSRDISMCKNKL